VTSLSTVSDAALTLGEKDTAAHDDFDVIEVSDAWHYVNHWDPAALATRAFIRAMSTLGISVGQTWTTPLVAVRDSRGQTIWYREGVRTVAPLASAFASLR
jgi:hypothetical protein